VYSSAIKAKDIIQITYYHMDFSIYPFKRYKKIRFYVSFKDENGRRKKLSTGITCPLDPPKDILESATRKAEEKAPKVVLNYFKEHKIQISKENKVLRLSKYLTEYYYPRVRASCAESTLVSYKGALNHFIRICEDRRMDEYKRSMMNRYKLHRFVAISVI
jgi:hypothetical protein